MEHYICNGGCKGESQTPGVCQTDGCPKHGQALDKCDCTDGKHHGAFDFAHEHEKALPDSVIQAGLPEKPEDFAQ